jgi:hypothetical protein
MFAAHPGEVTLGRTLAASSHDPASLRPQQNSHTCCSPTTGDEDWQCAWPGRRSSVRYSRCALIGSSPEPTAGDRGGNHPARSCWSGLPGPFAAQSRIRVEHQEETEHGLRINTLPASKGARGMKGTVVGVPYGSSDLCPVRALRRWQQVAGITEGPLFRRIWATTRPVKPLVGWIRRWLSAQSRSRSLASSRPAARRRAYLEEGDLFTDNALKGVL